jgi:predicted membrane protein
VNSATNPRFHALLTSFRKETGCSVLINTSFNVRGEPIVCTPERELRRFGLLFGGIVGCLFGLIIPYIVGLKFPLWPWIVLLIFVAWGLVAPASMSVFYKIWMRFGLVLNAITSRLILGVVFYVVVLPIGVVVRMRGRDPMKRKLDKSLKSYRVPSEGKEVTRMEKPF